MMAYGQIEVIWLLVTRSPYISLHGIREVQEMQVRTKLIYTAMKTR